MKFRKRPVVVEAEQIRVNLLGPSFDGGWLTNNPFGAVQMRRQAWWKAAVPMIETLEGWLTVSPGDWIIKGVKGEFYPCKPDVFELTYSPVNPKGRK